MHKQKDLIDYNIVIIQCTHYLFSDGLKVYSEFLKSVPLMSSSFRLHDNQVKDTQRHG